MLRDGRKIPQSRQSHSSSVDQCSTSTTFFFFFFFIKVVQGGKANQ